MNVIIIEGGEKVAETITQLARFGHRVWHAMDEMTAKRSLKQNEFDVMLFIDCERLEETDLVAERLRGFASETAKTYVFVIWDAVCEFDTAHSYGLQAIDILIEKSSARVIERAYEYARCNKL